jgi:hypothetical protein
MVGRDELTGSGLEADRAATAAKRAPQREWRDHRTLINGSDAVGTLD